MGRRAFAKAGKSKLVLTTALGGWLLASPATAQNLPTGFAPVAPHTATYVTGGTTGTVNLGATQRTIINWTSFDVAPGHTVNFIYGGPTNGAVLNRVIGANFSSIDGTITGPSNLEVFIINPNGILFGPSANVNVGGFVASTLDLGDGDFLDGSSYNFTGVGATGISVLSGATITTTGNPGNLIILGGSFFAEGSLTAAGDVAVLAGSDITVSFGAGSPMAMTINQGTPVAGSFVVGGSVSGRNIYSAMATRAGVIGAVLDVQGNLTATSATISDRGIVLAAGTSASGITIASGGGNDTSGEAGISLSSGATLTANRSIGAPPNTGDVEARARNNVAGTGSIAAAGDVDLSSALGNVTFDGPGTIVAGTGIVAVAPGTVRIAAADTTTGNLILSAGSQIELASTLRAQSGSVTLTGNTVVTGDTTVTASTVNFNNSVDGPAGLTINALSTVFGASVGAVTALSSLEVNGGTNIDGVNTTILTTGSQNYNGATSLRFGGSTTFQSAGGGNISFNGQLNGADAVTINTTGITTFAAAVGSATRLSSLSVINGPTSLGTGGISTTGDQFFVGVSGTDVALDSSAGSIVTGAITARDDIAIRAAGSVTTGAVTSGTTVGGSGPADVTGGADALAPDGTLEGADVRIWANGVTLGPVRANGAGAGIKIDGGAGGIGNGALDLNLRADAAIVLTGDARGRDVGINAGTQVITGAISARDDIAIRAVGSVATGALTSGVRVNALGPSDLVGVGDTMAPDGTLEGADIRIWGNGVTLGAVRANGAGAGIKIDGGARGIGSGAQDLDLQAGASIVLTGPARGRDIALGAGLSVITGMLEARDDIVIRLPNSGGTAIAGRSAGVTVDGQPPEDSVGAADALAGETLTGNRNEVRRDP